jgi:hypothetical protein
MRQALSRNGEAATLLRKDINKKELQRCARG